MATRSATKNRLRKEVVYLNEITEKSILYHPCNSKPFSSKNSESNWQSVLSTLFVSIIAYWKLAKIEAYYVEREAIKIELIWFDLLLTLFHKLRRVPCDILLTSTYWQEMFCNLLCGLFDPQYKVAKLLLPFHLHTDRPILKLIYFYQNIF